MTAGSSGAATDPGPLRRIRSGLGLTGAGAVTGAGGVADTGCDIRFMGIEDDGGNAGIDPGLTIREFGTRYLVCFVPKKTNTWEGMYAK